MGHTLTIRLTPEQAAWLERAAKETGLARGEILRDQLDRARAARPRQGFLRLAGTIAGPPELSRRKGFSRT